VEGFSIKDSSKTLLTLKGFLTLVLEYDPCKKGRKETIKLGYYRREKLIHKTELFII